MSREAKPTPDIVVGAAFLIVGFFTVVLSIPVMERREYPWWLPAKAAMAIQLVACLVGLIVFIVGCFMVIRSVIRTLSKNCLSSDANKIE